MQASHPGENPAQRENAQIVATPSTGNENKTESGGSEITFCHSCDRCRSRKTKCDGAKPCGNCAAKYMKKNKLTSIDGIHLSLFECKYSVAKRRGPVPGRLALTRTKGSDPSPRMNPSESQPPITAVPSLHHSGNDQSSNLLRNGGMEKIEAELKVNNTNGNGTSASEKMYQQQPLQATSLIPDHGLNLDLANQQYAAQQQLTYIQELQKQQEHLLKQMEAVNNQQQPQPIQVPEPKIEQHLPGRVLQYIPVLDRNNSTGNQLRSFYNLCIDELLCLPPIPTDDEYCASLGVAAKPNHLPRFDVAALQAARFAEIALGALVNNQIKLALELSDATVVCLRECVEEPVHPNCMFDLARAYFLHALFRCYRGDMKRYFLYRRVTLTHLRQLNNVPGVEFLFAAIAIHDSWAYMIYDTNNQDVPEIDDIIPPLPPLANLDSQSLQSNDNYRKYGINTNASDIASHPNNQMWIQGAPPVYINNMASPLARSLDGLAFAFRSCFDQANHQFGEIVDGVVDRKKLTPTTAVVLANQPELCAHSMVLSAYALLQVHEVSTSSLRKHCGHHIIISAMDAFLEGSVEWDETSGGFTDSQIQSLMSVCYAVLQRPLLLYQAGPIYHIVSNTVILLCHLLNQLFANNVTRSNDHKDFYNAIFEELLETFVAMRKMLNNHRRKLPRALRCHHIPPPNMSAVKKSQSYIDLGETLMCNCRSCQGFVLMACSPTEAAERTHSAKKSRERILASDGIEEEIEVVEKELVDLYSQCDALEDDLLGKISRLIRS